MSDWVKVKYNEARYGRSNGYPCASNVCSNTWALVRDGIDTWVQTQKDAGKTDADIKTTLSSYDQWDRNDFDHDGNFNEPDGYIDHFQIVHAGGDQADGDPIQGEDAIWSHRWKAYQGTGQGPTGNKDGGTQIGTTGLWVADYTVQPENGGVCVFAHEYTHDLGLPDLYDTSGPSANENGVNYWSLMAQSREAGPNDEAIGTRASDLGAWDKLQLGWLDYEIVNPRTTGDKVALGPHEYNSDEGPGGRRQRCPRRTWSRRCRDPYAGTKTWWSGHRRRPGRQLSRDVDAAGRHDDADVPGAAGTSRTAARHLRLRATSRSTTATGWKAIPGNITKRPRTTASTASQRRPGCRHVRPVRLRRQDGRPANALRHRRCGQGTTDTTAGLFVDDDHGHLGATTLLHRRRRGRRRGLDARRLLVAWATRSTRPYDNYYIASQPRRTCPSTSTSRLVRTTSVLEQPD